MEIKGKAGGLTKIKTQALVVNLFQGVNEPQGATGAVDKALEGAISQLIQEGEIKGRLGEITLIHTLGKIPASRVVVTGLGKADDFDHQTVRRVSGDVVRYLRQRGITQAATVAHGAGIGGLDPENLGASHCGRRLAGSLPVRQLPIGQRPAGGFSRAGHRGKGSVAGG